MSDALFGVDIDGLTDKLRRKDAKLYDKLCLLPLDEFWREWKKVYPEDFPEGGMSLVHPSSVTL